MDYADGRQVRLNDHVGFDEDEGVVVCSMDTDEYTDAYPKKDWAYLKKGVMIDFSKLGLVYFGEKDMDLHLVRRGGPDV